MFGCDRGLRGCVGLEGLSTDFGLDRWSLRQPADGPIRLPDGSGDVKVKVADARKVRFKHPDLKVIVQSPLVERVLELAMVASR